MRHLAKPAARDPSVREVLEAFPGFDESVSIPMLRRHFNITKHTAVALKRMALRHQRAQAPKVTATMRRVMEDCGVNEAEARWWLEHGDRGGSVGT